MEHTWLIFSTDTVHDSLAHLSRDEFRSLLAFLVFVCVFVCLSYKCEKITGFWFNKLDLLAFFRRENKTVLETACTILRGTGLLLITKLQVAFFQAGIWRYSLEMRWSLAPYKQTTTIKTNDNINHRMLCANKCGCYSNVYEGNYETKFNCTLSLDFSSDEISRLIVLSTHTHTYTRIQCANTFVLFEYTTSSARC